MSDQHEDKAPDKDKPEFDHDDLRQMTRKALADRNIRITQELSTRPLRSEEPAKEIKIFCQAAACGVEWESMGGISRVRFCPRCKLQVYDFTGMDDEEAENLVFQREERRGVAFFKRADGKFLTGNCPIGLAKLRKRRLIIAAACFVAAGLILVAALSPHQEEAPAPKGALQAPRAIASSKQGSAGKQAVSWLGRFGQPKGVIFKVPPAPAPATLPPPPNTRGPYPAAHNPYESHTERINKMPELAILPEYTGYGAKVFDVVYHPYLRGGRQCYQQRMLCRQDTAAVISWYRRALARKGWVIQEKQTTSSTLVARRAKDGSTAILWARPTSIKGFRSLCYLRYVLTAPAASGR